MANKPRKQQRGNPAPAEYDEDNLSRQRQSEGTPRPFDEDEARKSSRSLVGEREHYSEAEDEDELENLEDEDE